jgi:hypothetical protein
MDGSGEGAATAPLDLGAIHWTTSAGEPVTCVEKLKVLSENLAELRQIAQDALDDALVMGCDERQTRAILGALIAGLEGAVGKV